MMGDMARSLSLLTLLILLAVGIFLRPDLRFGLSHEEGQALWAVRDDLQYNVAPRDAVRAFITDMRQAWERTQTLPQPPLYFVTLNIWTIPAGESIFAVRWLSTLVTLIGIAGSVAVAGQFDKRIRPALTVLFGTFTTFYAINTVYPYAFVYALSAISSWLLLLWGKSGRKRYVIVYSLMLITLLYTHHSAWIVILLHALWLSFHKKHQVWLVIGGAIVAYLPYLVFAGMLQLPPLRETLIGASVGGLPFICVGLGWLSAWAERSTQPAIRGLIPACILAGVFIVGITLNLIASFAHPNWQSMIHHLNAQRNPLESGMMVLNEQHPLFHYNRHPQTRWANGVMVNLGWQNQTPESVQEVASRLGDGRLWLVIEGNHPNTDSIHSNLPTLTRFHTIDTVDVWHFIAN
jgi:hypothetical protein